MNKTPFNTFALNRTFRNKSKEQLMKELWKTDDFAKLSDSEKEAKIRQLEHANFIMNKDFRTKYIEFNSDTKVIAGRIKEGEDNKYPEISGINEKLGSLKDFFYGASDIKNLTKSQTPNQFMKNVIEYNEGINYTMSKVNTPSSVTSLIKSYENFKKADSFYTWDLETLSGLGVTGYNELDSLQELSFRKFRKTKNGVEEVVADRIETVVGITQEQYDHYIDVLKNNRGSAQKYDVIAKRFAKLGHSDTQVSPVKDGIAVVESYASDNAKDLMSWSNIKDGLDKAREIGKAQEDSRNEHGLMRWQEEVLRGVKAYNENFTVGYNTTNFDFEKYNQQIAKIWGGLNDEQRSYYANKFGFAEGVTPIINSKAQDMNLDMISAVRQASAINGKAGIYNNDLRLLEKAFKNGTTLQQQETLGAIFAENFFEKYPYLAPHTAGADVTVLAELASNGFLDNMMDIVSSNQADIKNVITNNSVLVANGKESFNDFTRKGGLSFTHDRRRGLIRTSNGYTINEKGAVEYLGQAGKSTGIRKNVAYQVGFMGEFDTSDEFIKQVSQIDQTYAQGKLWAVTLNPLIDESERDNAIMQDSITYFFTSREAMEGMLSNKLINVGNYDGKTYSELDDKEAAAAVRSLFQKYKVVDGKVESIASDGNVVENIVKTGTEQLKNDPAARMIRENDYNRIKKIYGLQDMLYKKGYDTVEAQKQALILSTNVSQGKSLRFNYSDVTNVLGYYNKNKGDKDLYSATLNNTINSYEYFANSRDAYEQIFKAIDATNASDEEKQMMLGNIIRNAHEIAENRGINNPGKVAAELYGKDLNYFEIQMPDGHFSKSSRTAMLDPEDNVLRVGLGYNSEYGLIDNLLMRTKGTKFEDNSAAREAYGKHELIKLMEHMNESDEYKGQFDTLLKGNDVTNIKELIDTKIQTKSTARDEVYKDFDNILKANIDAAAGEDRKNLSELHKKRDDIRSRLSEMQKSYREELISLSAERDRISENTDWSDYTQRESGQSMHKAINSRRIEIVGELNEKRDTLDKELEEIEGKINAQYGALFEKVDAAENSTKQNFSEMFKEKLGNIDSEVEKLQQKLSEDNPSIYDFDLSVNELGDMFTQRLREIRSENPTKGLLRTKEKEVVTDGRSLLSKLDKSIIDEAIKLGKEETANFTLVDMSKKNAFGSYASEVVNEILMPKVRGKDGKLLSNINDIVLFAQEQYGYNKEASEYLRMNLEMQYEEHFKGIKKLMEGVASNGGQIAYNKENGTIGLMLDGTFHNFNNIAKTDFTNGVLGIKMGSRKYGAYSYLDVENAIHKGVFDKDDVVIRNNIGKYYDNIKYVGSSMNRAYRRGEDMSRAAMREIGKGAAAIRELPALGPSTTKDEYVHQRLDLSQIMTALPFMEKELDAHEGWEDKESIDIIKRNMKGIKQGRYGSDVIEAVAKNSQDLTKIALNIGAGQVNPKNNYSQKILAGKNSFVKDSAMAKLIFGAGGQYDRSALGQFNTGTRPPSTSSDEILLRKSDVDNFIKNHKSIFLESDNRLRTKRNANGKFIDGAGEVTTGLSFINLSIGEEKIRERIVDKFDKESKASGFTKEKEKFNNKLKNQLSGINTTEQEKLMGGEVFELMFDKAETQRIGTLKDFARNTEVASDMMKKRVADAMPIVQLDESGRVIYRNAAGQKVSQGDALFVLDQYGGGTSAIGVKENAGFFKFRYFGKDSNIEVDEKEIEDVLNKNKDKIIGKDGKIDSNKYQALLESLYKSEFVVDAAFQKGTNKATYDYAEKGMYTALMAGAGSLDDRVKNALDVMGLGEAQNKILKNEYIDYMSGLWENNLTEKQKADTGFKSFDDLKDAILKEKFAPTEFMRSIEGFEDVTVWTNDNVIKHGNTGTAASNFINTYAYDLSRREGISLDEATEKVSEQLKKDKVFKNMDFEYKDGKIIFGDISHDSAINVENLTKLADKSGIYDDSNSLNVKDLKTGEVIGRKFITTTAANIDESKKSASVRTEDIKAAIKSNREKLRDITDPAERYELEQKILDDTNRLKYANSIDKKMKISSREMDMMRLYTYEEKKMAKVKNKLDDVEKGMYEKIYGEVLDGNGNLKEGIAGSAINAKLLDNIEEGMIEKAIETKSVFDSHADAIRFNDHVGKVDKDYLLKNGFTFAKLEDLVTPAGEDTGFLLNNPNSSVGKNLLIDTGVGIGRDRYVAIAGGAEYMNDFARFKSGELDGNTLNADEVQTNLRKLSLAKQRLQSGLDGDKEILKDFSIEQLEGQVMTAAGDVREAMTKNTRNLIDDLEHAKLGRYSYKKASMISANDVLDFDMIHKSTINGKTIAEWQKKGVYHDVTWESLQHFEDQGYFKEETLKRFGFADRSQMEDYLETYGTMGLNLRTPTIREGSMSLDHQFLKRDLAADKRISFSYTGFRKNQDQDGDSNIAAELERHGITYAEYQRSKQEGYTGDAEKIERIAGEYFRSLEASNNYQAVMINPKVQKEIAEKGYKVDVTKAADQADVRAVLKSKNNINGIEITPLSFSEFDTGDMEKYKAMYGELQDTAKKKVGAEKFAALADKERFKLLDETAKDFGESGEAFTRAMRYVEIYGKDQGAVMAKVSGKASIGFINTPLATLRRTSSAVGLNGDDRQYMNALADVFEQNIISKKHSTDTAISIAQQFRNDTNLLLRGDAKGAEGIMKLISSDDYEFKDKLVTAINTRTDMDETDAAKLVEDYSAVLSRYIKATKKVNIDEILAAESMSRNVTGRTIDKALRGVNEKSSGNSRVLFAAGFAKDSSYTAQHSFSSSSERAKAIKTVAGEVADAVTAPSSMGGLGIAALGIAGAIMATGYIGGNPTTPADNQAEQMDNSYQSLQDQDLNIQSIPNGTGQGYVININAESERGQQHAMDAIQKAMHSSVTTDINISMNMKNNTSNISSRLVDKLLSGAL